MSEVLDAYIVNVLTMSGNRQSVLQWTTEKPWKTGLYRVKNKNGAIFWAYFTKEVSSEIQFFGSNGRTKADTITHWLGPLPVPDPPDL